MWKVQYKFGTWAAHFALYAKYTGLFIEQGAPSQRVTY